MRHSYYGYFYVRWKGGRETMKEGKNTGAFVQLYKKVPGIAKLVGKSKIC